MLAHRIEISQVLEAALILVLVNQIEESNMRRVPRLNGYEGTHHGSSFRDSTGQVLSKFL